MKNVKNTQAVATALAAGIVFTGLASMAQADVTIVSEVNVTGQPLRGIGQMSPNQTFPQTVTTYYKGGSARTETADGPVTIYNGANGKIYHLDPSANTYYVTSFKQAQEGRTNGRMKVDSKADLKQTNETQTLAGASARKYTLTGYLKFSRSDDGGFGGGGGFPGGGGGGGGFPGGGGGGGGFPGGGEGGFPGGGGGSFPGGGGFPGRGGRHGHRGGMTLPEMTVSGEVWLSDAVKLPDDKKATLLPSAQDALFSTQPLLGSLSKSLDKTKDLPLVTKITVTRAAPPSDTEAADGATSDTPQPLVMTMTVKSLSQKPLADALFVVPQNYTEADPPRTSIDRDSGRDQTSPEDSGPEDSAPLDRQF